ncbi:MAG: RNA-dependent DNA polymerase [Rhizobiales bacterium]|nr:RNA-dependent DNA polymerase [Hyphomicrobiales bacterium]
MKIPKDKKDKSNFRPLVVARVESRVVQRAIHDVLVTIPAIQKFVQTPFSFGGVKKVSGNKMAAVPAAIKAVLDAIGFGSSFVIRSDIANFFTRIPKTEVTKIVANAVNEREFMELFTRAITVELENMAQLREHAHAFPIEDIGVAQGNSLSPLLGNLILYKFDLELNKDADVRCIRYIDDFIILAPNKQVAENTFAKALHLLKNLGMTVSSSKTQRATTAEGFEFLGIQLSNGFIRPSRKAQERVIASIEETFKESQDAFRNYFKNGEFFRQHSLLETLGTVSGIMQGWGKHYRFCNDTIVFQKLDQRIELLLREYLSRYGDGRKSADEAGRWRLLGLEALAKIEREPFDWPKKPQN